MFSSSLSSSSSSSSHLLQSCVAEFTTPVLRLDTETCYRYEFTLIVRDFKIISTPWNPSTVNAEAWLRVLTHGSACSIRRKNIPSIINCKEFQYYKNISHLLFEDVYKSRENIPA